MLDILGGPQSSPAFHKSPECVCPSVKDCYHSRSLDSGHIKILRDIAMVMVAAMVSDTNSSCSDINNKYNDSSFSITINETESQ